MIGPMVGVGYIIMLKVETGPVHPFAVGVMVMAVVMGVVPVLVAV